MFPYILYYTMGLIFFVVMILNIPFVHRLVYVRTDPIRDAQFNVILNSSSECNVYLDSNDDILVFENKRTGLVRYLFVGCKEHTIYYGALFNKGKMELNSRLSYYNTLVLKEYIVQIKART